MRSIRSLTALHVGAIALVLGATACAANAPQTAAASPVDVTPPPPTVASGVSFHASLDGPLSSQHAGIGDRITATLDDPLLALDGATIVPRGAKLHGHVREVGREGINRLVMQFDTVEVGGKLYSIYAQVTRVDSARVAPSYSTDATSVSFDVYPLLPNTPARELGGGPPSEQVPLELRAGTGLQLVLSRPLSLDPTTAQAP